MDDDPADPRGRVEENAAGGPLTGVIAHRLGTPTSGRYPLRESAAEPHNPTGFPLLQCVSMDLNARQRLLAIMARLADADVEATLEFATELASRRDSSLSSPLAAPEEDEELSAEERQGLKEGLADHRAGRVFSSDQVKRELSI